MTEITTNPYRSNQTPSTHASQNANASTDEFAKAMKNAVSANDKKPEKKKTKRHAEQEVSNNETKLFLDKMSTKDEPTALNKQKQEATKPKITSLADLLAAIG